MPTHLVAHLQNGSSQVLQKSHQSQRTQTDTK